MSTLQEQLDRLIQRKGEQDPLVQMFGLLPVSKTHC